MLKIFRKDKTKQKNEVMVDLKSNVQSTDEDVITDKKTSIFVRLKEGLAKTRRSFSMGLAQLILGKKEIDAALLEEIEAILIAADVGISTTRKITQQLKDNISRKTIQNPEALFEALKEIMLAMLLPVSQPLSPLETAKPYVILVVGVNGAGKTTTIGKLAKNFQILGKKVMLAAGDTFRAAAIEQLQAWGERSGIPVISQQAGADSASVIFDALQSSVAKGYDILIADTAGRLHTQTHLMEELKKVKRVIAKISQDAPHEVLLVLDASIGQNALIQAQKFTEALDVSGIVVTKLDGTAKGGIIFAIADALKIPIRYIGIGEGLEDLKPFDPKLFVEALFADNIQYD